MKLKIAWIGRTKDASIAALSEEYVKRIGRYAQAEPLELRSEPALLELVEKTRPVFVLLDIHGKQLSSEELAEFLVVQQERGTKQLLFAVGPADGFSEAAQHAANSRISLGKLTLPHELARVVLLEQLYRAFTILAGHPYHLGH